MFLEKVIKRKKNKFCYVPIDDMTFERVMQYIEETHGFRNFFPATWTAAGLFCHSYSALMVKHYYVSESIKRVDGSSDFGYLIITSTNVYSVCFEAFRFKPVKEDAHNIKSDCPEELYSLFWEAMDYMKQNSIYDWIKECKSLFGIELEELRKYRETKYLYNKSDLWRWQKSSEYSEEWAIYNGEIVLPTERIQKVFK